MKRGNNPYDSLVSFISRCNISTREEVRLREIISDIKKFDESASLPSSSVTGEEEKDNFAISFAIWALHDPQAKAYQEAGITAYGLLEKYKNRPYINTDTSKQ